MAFFYASVDFGPRSYEAQNAPTLPQKVLHDLEAVQRASRARPLRRVALNIGSLGRWLVFFQGNGPFSASPTEAVRLTSL
jgi:hypothetical protein